MLNILAFWYQVIIASEPLLEECIAYLSDDGFEGRLKSFYRKHLEDERNHAVWLKEDLGDHQIDLHFTAAAMAGTMYYLVRHLHPVALMGYMIALEGHGIKPEFVAAVVAEHGEQAARTLKLHAQEDPKHIAELLEFEIPDEHKDLVEAVRKQTLNYIKGPSWQHQ